MKLVQIAINYLLFVSIIGLLNYEVAAKSRSVAGFDLPGCLEARKAEQMIVYSRTTDIPPMDALLHESREAVCFYSRLLR